MGRLIAGRVVVIREDLVGSLAGFEVGRVPVAVVTVGGFNVDGVVRVVGEVASRHHVATMRDRGYRNSRSL